MFEKAAQGLEQALDTAQNAGTQNKTSGDHAPGAENTSESQRSAMEGGTKEAKTVQDLIELDKIQKFKYQGREWTPQELQKAILRQKDYTQKTTQLAEQRKNYESDNKYYENLHYDLHAVRQNPNLVFKFKEIYPAKFHAHLDQILDQASSNGQPQGNRGVGIPRELINEISQMKNDLSGYKTYMSEQAAQAADKQLDSVLTTYSAKYPHADEESVLARASVLLDQTKKEDLSKSEWDNIFKSVEQKNKSIADKFYSKKVQEQKTANRKGREGARGGGTPGEAPKRMTFKEATAAAIRDLSGRQ